ncbi:LuxR C-terminal-related transcriptional regulator [Citrobacter amalonaticus]|uniref:helix-turn-helix transcriptional regulator n=1 Tax=Citrobacter amalonaticus TaxID=35703 RepID=UPI00292A79FB|nr:LuxR C-terminal-related transcriptional regulator [Citrobacter amalonaticus]MDV0787619.1 LuxR C-terminal-related transcriptional regulator [Citrobacter amalonaticus]MEB0643683.1 LuxR C-terminal-related transcriptional regulator [Citrobacter amalonaticus]
MQNENSNPVNNILLYTDHNFIGQSIYDYIINSGLEITTLDFQDITKDISLPKHTTIIINMIHKNITAETAVALLNTLRMRLANSIMIVLIVKSELAKLLRELLALDNILILTEKSSLSEYSAFINRPPTTGAPLKLYTRRRLTAKELRILKLIIACVNIRQIAELLDIDYKTVYSYKKNIMEKMGMENSRIMIDKIVNLQRI